ncbi:hypothetical protein HZP54_17985 [Elizabethkingia anophelis]|nr:hypothetical protein [Elizabethkingia anophelis]
MDYAEEPIYPDPMRGAEQSYTNQTPSDLPTGLSKKEYYAGLAMQGILASDNSSEWIKPEELAKKSIQYADELLKQLENTK